MGIDCSDSPVAELNSIHRKYQGLSSTLQRLICPYFPFCFPGLDLLRDITHSTPVHSITHNDSFISHSHSQVNDCGSAENSYSPLESILPTEATELRLEPAALITRHANNIPCSSEEEKEAKQYSAAVRVPGEQETTESTAMVGTVTTEVKDEKKFALSKLRVLLRTIGILFVLFLVLITLTESDLDVAFFQTPELEQFHYEYFCPLRRWFACKLVWVGGLLISK